MGIMIPIASIAERLHAFLTSVRAASPFRPNPALLGRMSGTFCCPFTDRECGLVSFRSVGLGRRKSLCSE